jgi:hypothetical protein
MPYDANIFGSLACQRNCCSSSHLPLRISRSEILDQLGLVDPTVVAPDALLPPMDIFFFELVLAGGVLRGFFLDDRRTHDCDAA